MTKSLYLTDCSRYDEKELLAEIAAGDERAFRELFDLYKERFYSLALKMTRSDEIAEDIVQDVFMAIWDKRKILTEVDNPPSYFFTIIYRRVYRYYRKMALERKLLQVIPPAKESVNTTEEMVLAHESNKLILQAISRLPSQQQLIFKLIKQEGLSRNDIASQLHISPNTVRNQLSDAIKSIRIFLINSTITFLILFWCFKK